MLNLDTHILLHGLAGDLTSRERDLLASQPWSISAIVLWEIAKLAELDRIEIDLHSPELVRTLSRVHLALAPGASPCTPHCGRPSSHGWSARPETPSAEDGM